MSKKQQAEAEAVLDVLSGVKPWKYVATPSALSRMHWSQCYRRDNWLVVAVWPCSGRSWSLYRYRRGKWSRWGAYETLRAAKAVVENIDEDVESWV